MVILYKKRKDGVVISSYLILYSLGRLFIEQLRTDSLMIGNIRIAQFMSIMGILIGIVYAICINLHIKMKR